MADTTRDSTVFPSTWSEGEIQTFHTAVKRFGTRTHVAARAIAYRIITKSPVQVLGVLHKLEERVNDHRLPTEDGGEHFLTQMAEEVTSDVDLELECRHAEKLVAEEETSFLDKTKLSYATQTGVLNPFNLVNYSKRMYAELLPGSEEGVVIPSETVWFLEQKMISFVKLVLQEADCLWPTTGARQWVVRKRKTAWGDPERFKFYGGAEVVYAAMKSIPNRDADAFFRRIDEADMSPFTVEVCETSDDETETQQHQTDQGRE